MATKQREEKEFCSMINDTDAAKSAGKPTVFWHSDPVRPNETVVLAGGNFSADSVVEFYLVEEDSGKIKWKTVKPVQYSRISLKAIVPAEYSAGIFACRVKQENQVSETVYLNEPDAWWMQGDEGVDRVRQSGWLRVLGKCLELTSSKTAVKLEAIGGGEEIALNLAEKSEYSLKAEIPATLPTGKYRVSVSNGAGGVNGWRNTGEIEVLEASKAAEYILNVVDFGADPGGMKDSTAAIVGATERLSCLGGGVVYFPRGRYRIDSILRSGTWITSPLIIPEKVSFRGDGSDLSCLWWPDQDEPLTCLIEGRSNFSIEDLSIYTQGRHSTLVSGENNVRINRVLFRANCYYMTLENGERAHHGRKVEGQGASGSAIMLWGDNNQVTNCDIYTSAMALDLRSCRGSLIADNKIRAQNMHAMSGCCEMIFERNQFSGNQLTTGGNNIALHMGASISKHVYYANNYVSHIYGGDREALTLDGHGTAYFGHVKNVRDNHLELTGRVYPRDNRAKGSMTEMHGTAVYITDGQGAGQYRWLTGYDGNHISIDRPWDIVPDESSFVNIGGFNGRHLFIGNTAEDTGTIIQLYPPNVECIVAGNRSIRTSNMNSLGKLGKMKDVDFVRVEVSWFNQFLDNRVISGNTWGGGRTEIDRWLGGESTLNIWGWEVYYYSIDGADFDEFMHPEAMRQCTLENGLRSAAIPISRFQIIRRHIVDNNSSIRVRGAVRDVLIEGCELNLSRKGIRVDKEMNYKQPKDLGQTFEFDPEPDNENVPLEFLTPESVMIRNNKFNKVKVPLSGSALDKSVIFET